MKKILIKICCLLSPFIIITGSLADNNYKVNTVNPVKEINFAISSPPKVTSISFSQSDASNLKIITPKIPGQRVKIVIKNPADDFSGTLYMTANSSPQLQCTINIHGTHDTHQHRTTTEIKTYGQQFLKCLFMAPEIENKDNNAVINWRVIATPNR